MFDTQDLHQTRTPPTESPVAVTSGITAAAHPLDRLATLFRHRRLAATAFTIVVAGLMLQTYTTVPLYRSLSQVLIQDERTTAVGNLNSNDPMFWQESDQYYNTQYSILRGRGLAKRIVRRLNLQDHPLFNGSAPTSRGPLQLARDAKAAIAAGIRKAVGGSPAVPVGRSAADETAIESGLISQFLAGLQVVPEKSTRLVAIVYTSPSAEFAALAANTVAEEYAQQNLDLRLDAINKNLIWLGEEVRRQEAKVTAAEAAMTQYRESENALSLEDRQNIVVSRLNALNDTVTKARTVRLQKEALFRQIKDVDPSGDAADAFPAIASNAAVAEAKNRLAQLVAERARLLSRYQPGHPEMAKLAGQIENSRAALSAQRASVIDAARNEYESALIEERSLSSQLEGQKAAAMDLDRKSGKYLVLQREAESNRSVYQALLQQEKELRVVSNSRNNNVQLMDRAEIPGAPFSPNARRDWFTALLAGLLAAIGLAFLLEYLDDTIRTPEDVSKRLNLALLGIVPAVRGPSVPLLSEQVSLEFGEAFRSLRTSIAFTSTVNGPRVVAVTSSQPLEGKTTTASNLATALAIGGSRVLLVDADMRRPGVHKLVGVGNEKGLSHLLAGQAHVRSVIQATRERNLFVIPAGLTPPNPSELLSSDRMRVFLKNLQTGPFDWVIVDTPPVLAVTDAVIVTRAVSGVVFVIGSEMTRRVHAERALEILMTARPRSLGCVLNRVDFQRNNYYYSRYYGYHYQNYYRQTTASA